MPWPIRMQYTFFPQKSTKLCRFIPFILRLFVVFSFPFRFFFAKIIHSKFDGDPFSKWNSTSIIKYQNGEKPTYISHILWCMQWDSSNGIEFLGIFLCEHVCYVCYCSYMLLGTKCSGK